MNTDDIIRALASEREAQGLSRAELGRRLDVSRAAVGQWEAGKRKPDVEHLRRWADALGLSLHVSLGDEGQPAPELDQDVALLVARFARLVQGTTADQREAVSVMVATLEAGAALARR